MKCTTCGGMTTLGFGGPTCSRCCGSGDEPAAPVADTSRTPITDSEIDYAGDLEPLTEVVNASTVRDLELRLSDVTTERGNLKYVLAIYEHAWRTDNRVPDRTAAEAAKLLRGYPADELARLSAKNQRQGADSTASATTDPSADQGNRDNRAGNTPGRTLQEATETPGAQSAPATHDDARTVQCPFCRGYLVP